jgi:hypothetical protein
MTDAPPEEIPDLDGPDPHTWRGNEKIHLHAEDVRAADDMLKLLSGEIAQDGMSGHFEEARSLVRMIARTAREQLALALLDAYGIALDDEGNPVAPEEAAPA